MSLVHRPAPLLALMSIMTVILTQTAVAADFAAPVDVDEVIIAPTNETVSVVGRVVALKAGPVAARTAAAVAQVHVNVGDAVKTGDNLVTLHNNRQRSTLALAKAGLEQWRARVKSANLNYKQAQLDLNRLEKLRGSSAFNRSLYDQRSTEASAAAAAIAEAEANLSYAKVQVAMAQQDLDWTEVRAPYDAVVSERHVSDGQWVSLGAPVVSIVSTRFLEIEVDVPAKYLTAATVGQEVTASVNGQALNLTLRALLPSEQGLSRTRLVRLAFAGEVPANLSANQAVNVSVPVSQSEALTVHKDAVVRNGDMSFVYKVVDGAATFAPVQLGASSGQRLKVEAGLQAGDIVVTRGNERLQPGQKVQIRGAKP